MKRIYRILKLLLQFVTRDIWLVDKDIVRGPWLWAINAIKTIILCVRFFLQHRLMGQASALAYYTLLALVPLLALLLGLSRGFGLQKEIEQALITSFPGQQEALLKGFEMAGNYLEFSQHSIVIGIGTILLLWVIFNLLDNIESTFNIIWHVKSGRSWARKIPYYMTIVICAPILLAVMSGAQIYLQTVIRSADFDPTMSNTLLTVIRWASYIIYPLFFTAVYKVTPHTTVQISKALLSGIIAGIAFLIFQQYYISGQIWVAKYNAIYGSLAALPLLLLWLQMSWVIALFGAELCYASQNASYFNFKENTQNISPRYFKFLCVSVASVIYVRQRLDLDTENEKTFNKYPLLSTSQLNLMLRLPSQLLSEILALLEELYVIRAVPQEDYQDHMVWMPSQNIETYTMGHLIRSIENKGTNEFKFHYENIFSHEWEMIQNLQKSNFEMSSTLPLSHTDIDIEKISDPESDIWSWTKPMQDILDILFFRKPNDKR